MNIFNSLGSSYDLDFVVRALFSKNDPAASAKLKSYLEDRYQGQPVLLYKGREAIGLALRLLNLPKESAVAFNGFTCYAVYQAVKNTGSDIEYVDIRDLDLNFSPADLKAKLKTNPKIKAVIIQNTLGYPCDIEEISKICRQYGIILIEDLAHSIGARYAGGQEAGTVGDLTVLSFSQDKLIDGVSGGALIIRNKKYQNKNSPPPRPVSSRRQNIDRFYPLLTFLIRTTYPIYLGRALHLFLKKLNLLSLPMEGQEDNSLHRLPNRYCQLIYNRFNGLDQNLGHRGEIASIYAQYIDASVLSKTITDQIADSANLRFPIFTKNRVDLINSLKESGIYVSDIWYDAPIAPKKYLQLTDYRGQCPTAEKASAQILNLPTHKNVSEKSAREISGKINLWIKSS